MFVLVFYCALVAIVFDDVGAAATFEPHQPGKIWTNSQCRYINFYTVRHVKECGNHCLQTDGCNAFIFYEANFATCITYKCHIPIPEPTVTRWGLGWTAYSIVTGSQCNPECQNGATCNLGKCDCKPGWIGDACDIACGKVNRKTKIVGGEATEMHEYPWQIFLKHGPYICGGSLISDRWVLTAAHCTDGGTITVTLGNHLLNKIEDAEIEHNIKRFINHPDYFEDKYKHLHYDFALVELETSLDLAAVAPHISPVCLPNADDPSQYDDVQAVVTGWGETSYGTGALSNVLLEASVKTMTNSQCNQGWGYNARITESMICAAENGKSPCQGDSGGPLVTDMGGYYNLIGVVSFGYHCHPKVPAVYGRVTHVLDWIADTTSQTGRSA